MKNKVWLMTATLLLFTAGCGKTDLTESKINGDEQKTIESREMEETTEKDENASGEKKTVTENENTESQENGESYTWKDVTLQFPENWKDRYVIEEDENGFTVFQKASYEKGNGMGYLFGILKDTEWYPDAAGVSILGYTDDGALYELAVPTDVSCDVENETVLNEYQKMMQQSDAIVKNVKIDAGNLHMDADQYIIPVSMIMTLKTDQLVNMSDNDLWLARNEIYARHGRGFSNEYLQSYFDSCSWYEKSGEPDTFDESVLNQTEKDNLKVIQEAETAYADEHPYPKEYKTGQKIVADINGDGREEEIRYDVKESGDYAGYSCVLTIDGTAYELCEYAAMVTPETECFYITDIAEYDNPLEIAVLDDGPSADYVTYFYRYDGNTLEFVGEVGGFPFKEQNDGINGFTGQNGIFGTIRTDILETAYLDGYWWYDSDARKLEYMDDGVHKYQYFTPHKLYVDLPLWKSMDQTSDQVTVSAGQNVFFISSDAKEWIYVRAKDGTEGYIHVDGENVSNVGRPGTEVFSELNYFD
ncbi:MAG TPA: serine/threonine protein kinase [Roseburia sp.]|nr:serine/threonine protein kinase [Roseburia sp.]